jgi:hypothetical protein
MIKITDLMRDLLSTAFEQKVPCILGTASKDGVPQASPRGSMAVFDGETLSYWEFSLRRTYQNIRENPNVVVYYRNAARMAEIPYRGGIIRFYGKARIVEGAERERVWDLTIPKEKEEDPEKKGVAVLIRLDRIEDIKGNVIMQRD